MSPEGGLGLMGFPGEDGNVPRVPLEKHGVRCERGRAASESESASKNAGLRNRETPLFTLTAVTGKARTGKAPFFLKESFSWSRKRSRNT